MGLGNEFRLQRIKDLVRAYFNQGWRGRICLLHNIVPTKIFVILSPLFWFWEPTYSFQIHTSEWLHIVSLVTIHNSYSEWCLSFYCFSLNANWSSCYKKLLISTHGLNVQYIAMPFSIVWGIHIFCLKI